MYCRPLPYALPIPFYSLHISPRFLRDRILSACLSLSIPSARLSPAIRYFTYPFPTPYLCNSMRCLSLPYPFPILIYSMLISPRFLPYLSLSAWLSLPIPSRSLSCAIRPSADPAQREEGHQRRDGESER